MLLAWGPYTEISEESKGDQLIQLIEVFLLLFFLKMQVFIIITIFFILSLHCVS